MRRRQAPSNFLEEQRSFQKTILSKKGHSAMAEEMKVKGIYPGFGSKRGMAALISHQLGPHRAYWEPFCGSMAVLLAKPVCTSETVCDLHGDLINLAQVIQDKKLGPALYRWLRRTLVSEELYDLSAIRMRDYRNGDNGKMNGTLSLDRAYHFFVGSWLGRNGLQGTTKVGHSFTRRFTMNGGHSGTRFAAAVDSIPAWRRRMREVTILEPTCGLEICEKIDDANGISIYCDPPYLAKGAEYLHDFKPEDHLRLAKALNRFKRTRVVVSYYAHPMLEKLYPLWTVIDCKRSGALSNQGSRGKKSSVSPEVLLINQAEIPTKGLF
jgi:DNA adenine methylase